MPLSLSPGNPVDWVSSWYCCPSLEQVCTRFDIHISEVTEVTMQEQQTLFIIFSSDLVGPWQHLPAREWAVALGLCLVLVLAISGTKSDVCYLLLVVT